jgi:arylsulfatase A-like enzyme
MHGTGYEKQQRAPAYMWRKKDWKLILFLARTPLSAGADPGAIQGELYNLKQDPWEHRNLYDEAEYLAKREELTRELLIHLAVVWAKYPYKQARAELRPAVTREGADVQP